MRTAHTAVLERNLRLSGDYETEGYEAAWAAEAVFFVRALTQPGADVRGSARVQISPDGMHWVDEGTEFALPAAGAPLTFARVRHFGGWLRLRGSVRAAEPLPVVVALVLKS